MRLSTKIALAVGWLVVTVGMWWRFYSSPCQDTVKIYDMGGSAFKSNGDLLTGLAELHKSIPEKPCDSSHRARVTRDGAYDSITVICECKE